MHTVATILRQKGPHTNYITAGSSVLKAARVMKQKNRSYLIVRSNGKYVGILSEKDCVYKLILKEKDARTTLVQEIMTTDLPVVGLDDTAEQCMLLINSSKSRYLPAFDEDKFKGIITIHDLMTEALIEHEIHDHHWVD
ncbi:MAG: CBS domain-containing protein [Ginsengibacter sp.]